MKLCSETKLLALLYFAVTTRIEVMHSKKAQREKITGENLARVGRY
jgi:ribosomal protein S8